MSVRRKCVATLTPKPTSATQSHSHFGGSDASPGARQEAREALNVGAQEVAEVDLGEVQGDQVLQHCGGRWALQRKQRAVIMHRHLHLPSLPLHVPKNNVKHGMHTL